MPCCSQTNGLGGLGQIEVEAIAAAYTHAKDLWEDFQKMFGIGAGRMEADVIVPLQNDVHREVLAPVGDFLEKVRTNQLVPTCTDCTNWRAELLAAEKQWLNYLHSTQWQDGRAAQQAENTLAPIFKSQKDELLACVTAKCGGVIGGGGLPPIFTNPDGSTNWPIIAAGAGLVYALMRRK